MRNLLPADYLSDPSHYHLVDVRSEMEWEACHDERAIHVPLTSLLDDAAKLPRDKPLVIICRTGGRSMRACDMLDGAGLELYNLAGGMRALVQAKREKGLISSEQCDGLMANL